MSRSTALALYLLLLAASAAAYLLAHLGIVGIVGWTA